MHSIARLLTFAPRDRAWLDDELRGVALAIRHVRDARDVVRVLVDDPPPRPQILVVDLESLTAGEVLHLHDVRDRGWFGSVIALGAVSPELRRSLAIERLIARPLANAALRTAIARVGIDRTTVKMRPLAR